MIGYLFRYLPVFIERIGPFRVPSSSQQSLFRNPSKHEGLSYKIESAVRVKLVGIGKGYIRPRRLYGTAFCT